MAQKMPRNQTLHERRHHRKAGAHGAPSRPLTSLRATLVALEDEYGADGPADRVDQLRAIGNIGAPPVVYAEVFTDLFNECVRMMGGNDGEA